MTINDILTKIKSTAPQLFDKKGKLILEKFKAYLNDEEIPLSKESYTLNWLGKSYAKALVNDKNRTLLSPNTTHNAQEENAQSNNLLIQGDNLAVLKHVRKAYRNSVKMIYIDPPYNTGSDGFVYNDDRKYSAKQIAEMTGENDEVAERIFDFINRNASSHSAWLTFMYPRLKVARELLKDDGVIFISIDDNEQAQLKMLCDEVFGEENFITQFLWNKTSTPPSLSNDVRKKYEYILCYQKSNDRNYGLSAGEVAGGDMPLLNESNSIRDLIFSKKSIKFKINGFFKKGIYDRVELLEDINVANGKSKTDLKLRGKFKWIQSTLKKETEKGTIFWVKTEKFAIRYERNEVRVKTPSNIISKNECDVGTNEDANKEIKIVFDNETLFDFPKPSSLVSYLINMIQDNNSTILDFFAGSGTTAHAVMQLNAEDGGNRNYICVQLDEATDKKSEAHKAGYNTIFEITKERIKRAATKIKEENNTLFKQGESLDLGFKEFRLEPYPKGYGIAPQTPQEGVAQGELFAKLDLDNEKLNTLLTTWTVNDGLPLTEQTQAIDLNGYTAYAAENRLYLLYEGFNNTHLVDLLAKLDDMQIALNIEKIIAFGHHFESKTLREIAEAVNQYKTRKGVQLYWETRYE